MAKKILKDEQDYAAKKNSKFSNIKTLGCRLQYISRLGATFLPYKKQR